MEDHDLPVDAFATPSGVIRCTRVARKPSGIRCALGLLTSDFTTTKGDIATTRWDLVGPQLEEDIGALSPVAAQKCAGDLPSWETWRLEPLPRKAPPFQRGGASRAWSRVEAHSSRQSAGVGIRGASEGMLPFGQFSDELY